MACSTLRRSSLTCLVTREEGDDEARLVDASTAWSTGDEEPALLDMPAPKRKWEVTESQRNATQRTTPRQTTKALWPIKPASFAVGASDKMDFDYAAWHDSSDESVSEAEHTTSDEEASSDAGATPAPPHRMLDPRLALLDDTLEELHSRLSVPPSPSHQNASSDQILRAEIHKDSIRWQDQVESELAVAREERIADRARMRDFQAACAERLHTHDGQYVCDSIALKVL